MIGDDVLTDPNHPAIYIPMTANRVIVLFRTMSRRIFVGTLTFVYVPFIAFACWIDDDRDSMVKESDPIERGQRIFVENCAACHGLNGEGQPHWRTTNPDGTLPAPPLNGDGHTWHHGDGTLYKQVSLGGEYLEAQGLPGFKSGMPAFGEQLTHQEIIDVLTYIKSLWGDQMVHGTKKSDAQAMVSENDPFPDAPISD